MNEVEVAPMMMYGSVSGFYINQKSPVILRLMFTEQKYVYPSILISSFTWIAVGILIGTEKIQQKRMKKEHNRLRSSTSTRLTENEKEVNHRILRLPFKKE
jgi:hypothetical protein